MKKHTKRGSLIIETVVTFSIITTIVLFTIPTLSNMIKTVAERKNNNVLSAITMEKVIDELINSRAILHPRAQKGARRSRSLIYLDERNNLGSLYCNGLYLIGRKINVNTKECTSRIFGRCSSILFHDRGKTRRCLRVRTITGKTLAATTVNLTNRPFPKEPITSERTSPREE